MRRRARETEAEYVARIYREADRVADRELLDPNYRPPRQETRIQRAILKRIAARHGPRELEVSPRLMRRLVEREMDDEYPLPPNCEVMFWLAHGRTVIRERKSLAPLPNTQPMADNESSTTAYGDK